MMFCSAEKQSSAATMYIHTYFERETFHWTLWCCNLYLWVIMVSDVHYCMAETCSGESFPRSINQVAVCSVSVVHQTTIWTKKDLESWFSVEGLDWCFCHVTKKSKKCPFFHSCCLDMVFCYQNCSDLLWEKSVLVIEKNLKFEAEGREFVKFLRSLEQFIQTVKGQNNFW